MNKKDKKTWLEDYRNLLQFRRRYRYRWPEPLEEFHKGDALGQWCESQHNLFRRNVLPGFFIALLLRSGFPLRLGVTYWNASVEEKLRRQDPLLELFIWRVELLKTYRDKHPHRWPGSKEHFRGHPLGYWTQRIRSEYRLGRFAPYKAKLLSSIGFPFLGPNSRWREKYEAVKVFMAKHPEDWRGKIDKKLYGWVANQRKNLKEGQLSPDRVRLLAQVGEDFPALDRWGEGLSALKAFRKRHPRRWPWNAEKSPEGFALGKWSTDQRRRFRLGKLSENQVEVLMAMRFPFQALHWDKVWMEHYQSLIAFRKRYPSRWPAQKEEYPEGNPLGVWVTDQKVKKHAYALKEDRVKLLNRIEFPWDSAKDLSWWDKLGALKAWRVRHPMRWPKNSAQDSGELRLAQWVTNQKQALKRGILKPERKKELFRLDPHLMG